MNKRLKKVIEIIIYVSMFILLWFFIGSFFYQNETVDKTFWGDVDNIFQAFLFIPFTFFIAGVFGFCVVGLIAYGLIKITEEES
jgi:hypothetical protein